MVLSPVQHQKVKTSLSFIQIWFFYDRVGLHSCLKVGTSLLCLITTAVSLHGVQQGQHLSRNTFTHTEEREQLEPEQSQEHLSEALAFPTTFGRYTQAASVGLIEITTKLCSQQSQHNI